MKQHKRLYLIVTAALLFIAVAGNSGCSKTDQPENKPQKGSYELKEASQYPKFNADRAFEYVAAQVAFGPRVPGTDAHKKTKEYLVAEFKKYADAVEEQDFTYPGYEGVTLNLTNIIARFNPMSPNRIFFCAHWDSRPRADQDPDASKHSQAIPGANDGGSGVGILLEMARVLKEQKPDYGVDFILFDGEDYGKQSELDLYCLGSKYFAAKSTSYSPAFGVLLDLVGDKDAVFKLEQNSMQFAPEVMTMVWQIASDAGVPRFSQQMGSAIYDDHIPLNQAGIKTIDIIDAELIGADKSLGRRAYWHTTKDDMTNIGKETLGDVGNVLTRLVYSLRFVNK